MSEKQDKRNLVVLNMMTLIWSLVSGLVGPYYVIYVKQLVSGSEKLGLLFSITLIFQSLTSYSIGRLSDNSGRRKPFLFAVALIEVLVFFLYTQVTQIYQVYILLAFMGISNGIFNTIANSFIGDLTKKVERGRAVGNFHGLISISSLAGLQVSDFMVAAYGIKSLFYSASAAASFSLILLLFIKEDVAKIKTDDGI